MPAQEPVPDVGTDGREFGDGVTAARTLIPFTPLNRKQLPTGKPFPKKLVEVIGVEDLGPRSTRHHPGDGSPI